ncbi:MAG: hypothetical protein ACE5J1_03425 [Nitrospiria bacterium]
MDRRKLLPMFLLFVFASSFSLAYGGEYPYLSQHNPDSHRSIYSSVWTVKGDLVILETEERTMRSFGVEEWKLEGFPPPEEGYEVTLILDRGNSIIDLTEPGGKGGFFGNEITGAVHFFDHSEKLITLKTGDDAFQSFALKDAAATKLNWIQNGRMVTLAMDGQNRVMDAYQPE